jgi:DNA invertase Pin-like site-specific DNA recombinase
MSNCSVQHLLPAFGLLKERGVRLHMIDLGGDVTSNGGNMVSKFKLTFTILAAVAEAERDRIRGRITEAEQDQRRRGLHLGGKMQFGFTLGANRMLVPHAA